MSKLIALYKTYRGGEWMQLSLESIKQFVDGIVVIASDKPWTNSSDALPENCISVVEQFREENPTIPIIIEKHNSSKQADQYRKGISLIADRFGADSKILVIDSDEVWDPIMLAFLKQKIEKEEASIFRTSIYTYLKSPLYRVWPTEGPHFTTITDCTRKNVHGRFCIPGRLCPDIRFHHYCYVREDEQEISDKYHNTSSQEDIPSANNWLNIIWPNLPLGNNLHMTTGYEKVWNRIKILTPDQIPPSVFALPFVQTILELEDTRWKNRLRETDKDHTIIPTHDWEKEVYLQDVLDKLGVSNWFVERIKTSPLELLWLYYWASLVPNNGRILELGCGHGGSTAAIAKGSNDSVTVTCVDPFDYYVETSAWGTVKAKEGNESKFWDTANRLKYKNKIKHLPMLSQDCVESLDPEGYDLVFIDANHSYENVKQDLQLTWPFVKPGGLLVGHDYTTRFPGVIKAADEFEVQEQLSIRAAVGTSMFYTRK